MVMSNYFSSAVGDKREKIKQVWRKKTQLTMRKRTMRTRARRKPTMENKDEWRRPFPVRVVCKKNKKMKL